jgi:hypothetical protein
MLGLVVAARLALAVSVALSRQRSGSERNYSGADQQVLHWESPRRAEPE